MLPPRASAIRLVDTQRRPVTYALLAAAGFFALLAGVNIAQQGYVVAGLCGVAVAVALVYAHAIHHDRPQPLSDGALSFIAMSVLAITIDRRGLVGVLWCHPLMLMFHLVTSRRASMAFDAAAFSLGVALSYQQYGGDTAFRVGVILLISSAFAHVYERIMTGHQARQEEQRQHLDLLVRCANVGGLEWDAATGRTRCSQRLRDMLGPPDGIDEPGWDIRSMVHPDDRPALDRHFFHLMAVQAQPETFRKASAQDFRLVLDGGRCLWVHAEALAVAGANGFTQKFIATLVDITQLRAAEADTRAALQRQQHLNQLRARFVAMTSHEFRTPLAAILSSAELIRHYSERLPTSERDALLDSIEVGVRRMTLMLERILLISTADAQMLEFQPRQVDLRQLCANIVAEVSQALRDSASTIETKFTLPEAVGSYDPQLIRHALGNLLSNAIKYSPNGAKVIFSIYSESGHTVFEVADQGIGIPASDLPELFEAFQRGSNVAHIKGTGLGLAIVKKSVELHGGRITVDSEVGVGTRFRITLDMKVGLAQNRPSEGNDAGAVLDPSWKG